MVFTIIAMRLSYERRFSVSLGRSRFLLLHRTQKFEVGCDIRRYGLALRPSKISVRSMRSICRYKVT